MVPSPLSIPETVALAVGVACVVSVLLRIAMGSPLFGAIKIFGDSKELRKAKLRASKMEMRAIEMETRALLMETRALQAEQTIKQLGTVRPAFTGDLLNDLGAAVLDELDQRKKGVVRLDAKTASLIQLALNNDNPNESAAAALAACKRIGRKS